LPDLRFREGGGITKRSGVTRIPPRFRTLGLWLVACALAVRLIVAPGFMPVASADGITVSMCTGQGAVDVRLTGDATRHLAGKSDPAMQGSQGCAFASLAVATAPDLPAVLAAPALLSPVAAAIIPLAATPHIGVPAPPPPPIGPPSLA
jgi:hypothetical protein